jgi:hypothetical protein
MTTFDLGLDIGYGWCTLRLRTPEADLQLRTHWLVDGLTELALAVEALLAGRPSVSVRWAMEMAGGHFIDIVADPQGQLHLAVTELEHGLGASTAEEIWSPVRGPLVLRATVSLSDFVRRYLSAMRVVRVTRVDASGMVAEWRHSFPQAIYEGLERQATARFGYKPLTTDEITSAVG